MANVFARQDESHVGEGAQAPNRPPLAPVGGVRGDAGAGWAAAVYDGPRGRVLSGAEVEALAGLAARIRGDLGLSVRHRRHITRLAKEVGNWRVGDLLRFTGHPAGRISARRPTVDTLRRLAVAGELAPSIADEWAVSFPAAIAKRRTK